MDTEVVVLTGGASRRIGADKASVPIGGVPLAERLVRALLDCGYVVTVLGRAPVPGCGFVADAEDCQGPASALSRFQPSAEQVFVMPCDVARFDPRVVALMRDRIAGWDAVAPVLGDVSQPLCALYRA